MADMNGQVALVTGGIRGIGLAICERLMNRGVKVAAGYASNADAAQLFADKYADRGVSVHQGNIGHDEDCERVIGEVRYVLSSGGHIAGIVNPPGPKAWYETGEDTATDPEAWRAAASKHKGSWWEDWTAWSDARAGAHVKPPPLGSKRHPALGDAPGEYVHG